MVELVWILGRVFGFWYFTFCFFCVKEGEEFVISLGFRGGRIFFFFFLVYVKVGNDSEWLAFLSVGVGICVKCFLCIIIFEGSL